MGGTEARCYFPTAHQKAAYEGLHEASEDEVATICRSRPGPPAMAERGPLLGKTGARIAERNWWQERPFAGLRAKKSGRIA